MKLWLTIALIFMSSAIFAESPDRGSLRSAYDRGTGVLEVDLTIGGQSDDEVLLYKPTQIRVGRDGCILIADSRLPCIKKFDSDGHHVWTIDSKGQGPGDIGAPNHLALNSDGSVIVYDIGNRRFSFFAEDGSFQKNIGISDWVWGLDVAPNGDIWVETRISDFDGRRGGNLIKLLRYSPDLEQPVVVDSALIKNNIYITNPVRTNVIVPFAPILAWDIAPSGNLVVARSKDYDIQILSPTLEVLNQYRRHGDRVKVTEDDKEAFFGSIVGNWGGKIEQGAPAFIRDNTTFPNYKPYFKHMYVDDEGYIVCQTYKTSGEGVVYDVFGPDGGFVNKVVLPELGRSCVLARGFIYQLERTDQDPAAIVRYNVNESGTSEPPSN